MLMLVRPMVSIHISNWVDPITFFTIESTFYMYWQLIHSYTSSHFFKPFYERPQYGSSMMEN